MFGSGRAGGAGGRAWERGGRELAGRGAGGGGRGGGPGVAWEAGGPGRRAGRGGGGEAPTTGLTSSRAANSTVAVVCCSWPPTTRAPRAPSLRFFRAMDMGNLQLALADVAGQGQGPDAAVVPAALAGQQGNAVGWSEYDVEQQAGQAVGRATAHRFLQAWRDENPQGSLDLTNSRHVFDWVSYLANHSSRKWIFQDGRCVLRFGICRIPSVMDTNTRDARVDFTMSLSDGKVIRLHPSKNHTMPVEVSTHDMSVAQQKVEGRHEAAPSGPRGKGEAAAGSGGKGQGKGGIEGDGKGKAAGGKAAWQAAPLPPRGNDDGDAPAPMIRHYEGVSRADLYPTRDVKNWAEARLQLSRQDGSVFQLDITRPMRLAGWRTPMFMWYLWFNNVESLKNQVPNVAEIWLVEAMNEPGFWFRDLAGNQFLVRFSGRGRGGVTVEAGRNSFSGKIAWR